MNTKNIKWIEEKIEETLTVKKFKRGELTMAVILIVKKRAWDFVMEDALKFVKVKVGFEGGKIFFKEDEKGWLAISYEDENFVTVRMIMSKEDGEKFPDGPYYFLPELDGDCVVFYG